jgi:protease-4
MNQEKKGFLRRFFGAIWGGLDFTRKVLHLIVLLVLFIGLFSAMGSGPKPILEQTTLVLNIEGDVVEQLSGSPSDRFWAGVTGDEIRQVQLRDIKRALSAAATDPKIAQVLLRTDEFSGAGVATLREIAQAITEFRKSGKKIYSYAYGYDQRGLFIAAYTDRVFLHPDGAAMLEGLGRNRTYYASLLNKLGVEPHVFRVGEFKSAVEPYLRDSPSDEARTADAFWLGDIWNVMLEEFGAARKLEPQALREMIDDLPNRLRATSGNLAALALKEGLVDELLAPDQLIEKMLASGAKDEDSESFRRVGLSNYLAQLEPEILKDEQVAIVVAEGGIEDGKRPPGTVGGDSTAKLVRKAREDNKVKAVVLRVDSPGGSGFASEIIRREIELTRKAGKPVVISMGDVAASGGYWISMTSDAIFANRATITGSIGIYAMFPSIHKGLDTIGVHSDGTATTWIPQAFDIARPLDPRLAEVIDSGIKHGYQSFISKVAEGRKTSVDAIDQIGRGRVWSAQQAKERGLVDQIGGLDDAIADAAARAKLSSFSTRYVESELSGFEKFLSNFGGAQWSQQLISFGRDDLRSELLKTIRERGVERDILNMIKNSQKNPLALYSYCFCEIN